VPETVRPVVRDSWTRSLDAAVPPTLTQAPLVWDENAIQIARERADWFAFAEHLLVAPDSTYAKGGHILTLFDAAGRMLASRGDPHAQEALAEINFRPGALWSESAVGTNGPGTALASGRSVHIVGAEHFCERWQPWHCAAVPVRDPLTGAIVGVLDISGFRESAHPHTLALAGTLAAAVAQMMAAHEAQRRVIVLRSLASLVGRWPADGLAAVDRGGTILGGAGPLPHALQRAAETPEPVRQALIDAVRRAGETDRPLEVRVPIGDGVAAIVHPVFDGGRVIGACLVVAHPVLVGRAVAPAPPAPRSTVRRAPRPGATRYTLDDVIGASTPVADAARLARIASANALPVLVLGESGTGKEVFAQGIHAASARGNGPFVAVNCAALPRDLIESELFGYVGGAFSGARREGQKGKFEAAEGGTIFLDEIVELSPAAQASLLRVLQEGEVTRVGSAYGQSVDVRVIAATNRDATACLAAGTLRQDLFYRLNVLTIPLPPLRERGATDIELLALEFLQGASTDLGLSAPAFAPETLELLARYSWPGNVRELKNLIRRLVALTAGPIILPDDLPPQMRAVLPPRTVAAAPSSDPARDELIAIVRGASTMTAAAHALGVTRSTLYRRMAQYGLRPGRALNDGSV